MVVMGMQRLQGVPLRGAFAKLKPRSGSDFAHFRANRASFLRTGAFALLNPQCFGTRFARCSNPSRDSPKLGVFPYILFNSLFFSVIFGKNSAVKTIIYMSFY